MGGKFKFSAQERDCAPFVCNETKVIIPSEIKSPVSRDFSLIQSCDLKCYNVFKSKVRLVARSKL